jgi:hypothetical protein
MKIRIFQFALVAAFLTIGLVSEAQCAMCKATAESASEHVDKGIGEGLNSGIVYLMGIPYILLAIIALVFYRKKIWSFFKA